ncbi:hypothetical protein CDV50_08950 [Haematobacter massiliensis]|uniref:Uncharacterized protein n=1 Tax=Haematobacter massiliensis TaxID=195105 RepID=A0A086YB14_9RHOB|nr:hypothetical protein [Haematobacter massiliensis]KFI31464.1 hypothetical protein CN97_10720 [Haematobacter massiliensis]OWJ71635.1 hypothetical protein CDV50_08950 [Haematobacter massiliensis]OWJ88073.1 hypothetical protein CDV51_03030 [Haematobacter massiliensis]QBJ23545.1 hypothetical protein HmaOT1_04285 [Haematobacter massiliensis]
MIELAFIACLTAAPALCEKKSLLFTEISPLTCMMSAQPQLAAWVDSHPKWRIAKWNCKIATGEKDI